MQQGRFGPYRVVSELGSGAQATVYLAEVVEDVEALELGDRVALKMLHAHLTAARTAVARFRREVSVLKAIDHPNVVRLFDAGAVEEKGESRPYLVTEFVQGQTLREFQQEQGAQAEALCRFIGREAAKGLRAIHAVGAVHRDLKPENVVLTKDHHVKIMDLGVALIRDDLRVSRTGDFVGSVLYAAPEQFHARVGPVDGRTDLYALGLLLYELVVGHPPFDGEGWGAIMAQHLSQKPPPPSERCPGISPFFETLLLSLLGKAPGERPADAGIVEDALEGGEASIWWREHERAQLARTRVFRPAAPREFGMVGREDALGRCDRLWREASLGRGRVLLLSGEAGIGKTRLIDEFAERVHGGGEDLNYLYGSALAGGAASAAGAFCAAVRSFLGPQDVEAALAGLLASSPALVPAFASFLQGMPREPEAETLTREALHTAFIRVIQSLAARKPTLVVIDDLHFAPEEGLALFASLAQAVVGHRVLLVGTARPDVVPGWRANLLRLSHVEAFDLERLAHEDVFRLLEEALGSERSAGLLAPRIAALSDGNPFFALETLRAQRDSGALTKKPDGTWTLSMPPEELTAPSVVRDLITARVAGLAEADRELLDLAAVCGYEFDAGLLADVLERPRLGVLRDLGRLGRTRQLVVARGRGFTFDHHLVQETLYQVLPELLREEYHAVLGSVLTRRIEGDTGSAAEGRSVEACRHLLRGDRGGAALRVLDDALDYLEANHLSDSLVALVADVLAVPGLVREGPRAALLLRRITHLETLGRRSEIQDAIEEVRGLGVALGDPALTASAEMRQTVHLIVSGRLGDALEAVERARVSAEEAGDAQLVADAENVRGSALFRLGRFEESILCYRGGLERALRSGNRWQEARARGNLAQPLAILGKAEQARDEYGASLRLFEALGLPREESLAAGNSGNHQRMTGNWAAAEPLLERCLELSRRVGYRGGEANALGNLGLLRCSRGRLDEALRFTLQADRLLDEIGNLPNRLANLSTLGMIRHQLGRFGEGRRDYEEAAEGWEALGMEGAAFDVFVRLAILEIDAGDLDRASTLLQDLADRPAQAGDAERRSFVESARAQLALRRGDDAHAVVHLQASLDLAGEDQRDTKACLAALGHFDLLAVEKECEAFCATEEFATLLVSHHWLERAAGDGRHACIAHEMLEALVAAAPEEDRDVLKDRLPLYREIEAAWRARQAVARRAGAGNDERAG